MSEAIFGLIGVIVGGVLQGASSWFLERRREEWAARKAGRLLAPDLARCESVLEYALDNPITWGELITVVEANLARWPEHAEVFAGTLPQDEWNRLLNSVRELEQLTWTPADREALVDPEDLPGLAQVVVKAFDGALTASIIGTTGIRRRRLRKFLVRFGRELRPIDEEEAVMKIMAVGGRTPPER